MTRIRKLLIANRGEIARRVMRTCRDLGIETVAVFSGADADMPFVSEADIAVRIGPAPSAESYLDPDRIIDAAQRTGADAIHPGYGFLAENADFAQSVADAGMIFVGPTPDAIRAMGSKKHAKALVAAADVAVVPGYDGADQDPAVLAAESEKIGLPVLLKASAGGGGKGMRRVDHAGDLIEAIASAKREAKGAFGDDTLLVEKYVMRPRHIEFQILGDAHGHVIHLYERECSIQRRHQKILEETPSPIVDDSLRERMGAAAVKVGMAIHYQGAGTVEFILAPSGEFFFLEVNTRLQVEHPITEAVTGLDLVAAQISIAEGRPLQHAQRDVPFRGAALEARIYAEDPAHDFLPQSGVITDWHLPARAGIRVDGGIETGSEVGIHYDPMLAKIIATGSDRAEALRRMQGALRALSVQGVVTNRELLMRILQHDAYVAGDLHTHFITEHQEQLAVPPATDREVALAGIAATLADHELRRRSAEILPRLPTGFRNNDRARQGVTYMVGDDEAQVEYRHRPRSPGVFDFYVGSDSYEARVITVALPSIVVEVDGVRYPARVVSEGARRGVHLDGQSIALRVKPRFPDHAAQTPVGGCIAPMPGKIVELRVAVGDEVQAGQVLLVMEAMKMEHTVTAPQAGIVEALTVAAGDQVEADALLAVVRDTSA